MKFTGICLITDDVLRLADFYQRVLGVSGEGDAAHMGFQIEGGELAIFSTQGMEGMAPGSMRSTGSGNFTLGLRVADVDGEYERIKALGVDFILLPTSHPWGSRSFWFRDPDGNIVDFYQVLES
jgi:catechol 2,3-dioxygenase-like lactoylglutathione lyase family enzyme